MVVSWRVEREKGAGISLLLTVYASLHTRMYVHTTEKRTHMYVCIRPPYTIGTFLCFNLIKLTLPYEVEFITL